MERNKSKRLKEKKYFDRFNKLNVYSYVRDNKIYLGVKPEEVNELFSNACGRVTDKGENQGTSVSLISWLCNIKRSLGCKTFTKIISFPCEMRT